MSGRALILSHFSFGKPRAGKSNKLKNDTKNCLNYKLKDPQHQYGLVIIDSGGVSKDDIRAMAKSRGRKVLVIDQQTLINSCGINIINFDRTDTCSKNQVSNNLGEVLAIAIEAAGILKSENVGYWRSQIAMVLSAIHYLHEWIEPNRPTTLKVLMDITLGNIQGTDKTQLDVFIHTVKKTRSGECV